MQPRPGEETSSSAHEIIVQKASVTITNKMIFRSDSPCLDAVSSTVCLGCYMQSTMIIIEYYKDYEHQTVYLLATTKKPPQSL